MYPKRISLPALLLAALALAAAGVCAGEKGGHEHKHHAEQRRHDAHVHGIASLNLALEGHEMHVELDSPAANLVGFEHAPSTEADHAELEKAIATLRGGDRLFRFNSEAGCRMEKVDVSSALLDDEHDEHGEKHSDDQNHEKEGPTHSDIEAAYHFECDQPGKLTRLTVELFEAFPGTEALNVQYVIETKQGAMQLTAAARVVKF